MHYWRRHASGVHALTRRARPRRADLFAIFEQGEDAGDGSGRAVVVNFGESSLIKAQVDRQLLSDALWAVLSVVLAAIMLRVGSQSTFLTAAGIFMILVRHQ